MLWSRAFPSTGALPGSRDLIRLFLTDLQAATQAIILNQILQRGPRQNLSMAPCVFRDQCQGLSGFGPSPTTPLSPALASSTSLGSHYTECLAVPLTRAPRPLRL